MFSGRGYTTGSSDPYNPRSRWLRLARLKDLNHFEMGMSDLDPIL